MCDTDSIDTDSVEAGNATHSGCIPSIKKATAAAIKSLIPKKRLRTNRSILDSDDEKSVNSVNIAIQNIFKNYYSLFNEGKTSEKERSPVKICSKGNIVEKICKK